MKSQNTYTYDINLQANKSLSPKQTKALEYLESKKLTSFYQIKLAELIELLGIENSKAQTTEKEIEEINSPADALHILFGCENRKQKIKLDKISTEYVIKPKTDLEIYCLYETGKPEKKQRLALVMPNDKICSKVTVNAEENTDLELSVITEPGSTGILILDNNLSQDANLELNFFNFGNLLINHIQTNLEADGSKAKIAITTYLNSNDKGYTSVNANHLSKNTKARIDSRSVLADNSTYGFLGNIYINKNGKNADSFLEDHVLLIGTHAKAYSVPSLEIKTNEVRAGHGATMGNVNQEHLYYMKTRGIPERKAVELIIEGVVINSIKSISSKEGKMKIVKCFEEKKKQGIHNA